uniref:Protein sprouty n=1 Tax=Megaselia scalaris TaxID=36166 RepID=T1GIB1_MEGSC
MDRKNGGDPLAAVPPPRPPKSLPRVHRPRAPEPNTLLSNSQGGNSNIIINSNNNNSTSSSNVTSTSNSNRSRTNPILPPLIALHNSNHNNNNNNNNLNRNNSNISSSFSRRRPPPPSPLLNPIPLTPTTIQPIINNNLLTSPSATAATTTTPFQNSTSIGTPNSPVTLASPRPETERLANEYVDTPLQRQNPNTPHNNNNINNHGFLQGGQRHNLQHVHQQLHSTTANHLSHLSSTTANHGTAASTASSNIAAAATGTPASSPFSDDGDCESNTELIHSNNTLTSRPITKQPTAGSTAAITTTTTTFVKDVGPSISPLCHDDHGDSTNLIQCPQCKRCRCEQCKKPRQLPSTWICNKSCLCSAESVIDYASCLCCVKALFFHSESMKDGADDPCSCAPHRRTARWGWLGAISILLPCLWCYWPMRGCIALCAKCYRRYAQQGCRCNQQQLANVLQTNNSSIGGVGVNNIINSNSNFSGEKRLLDTN